MNAIPHQPDGHQLAALYRLLAPLLATVFLSAGLVITLFTGHPIGGWLTVTAFLVASILIGRPRLLLGLFFALVVIHPTLQNLYAHWLLQLADKLLALLILGVVVFHFIKDRGDRSDLKTYNWILLSFIGLGAASAIVNRAGAIPALRFFMTYGTFIPAFYAAYYFLQPNAKDAKIALRAVMIVFGAQVLLNIGWLLRINPLPNHQAGTIDFAIGTVGLCNVVAYFTAGLMFILFALFHGYSDIRVKALSAFAGLAAMLQLALTFTFHVLPPMAALLFLQCLYAGKTLRYKIGMLALVGVLIGGFFFVKSDPRLTRAFGFQAEEMMTPSVFKERWDLMWRGPKGRAYYNIFVNARKDMPAWIIGAGPGNFASGIGIVHRSMLAEKYVNYIYLTYTGRMSMVGGSITQHVTTGYSAIYSEFGPFGLLLFFGLHGLAVLHVWRLFRRNAYRDPARRALAEAFIPAMLLYLGLNLISDFLSDTFLQTGIWLWAGTVWKPDIRKTDGSQSLRCDNPADKAANQFSGSASKGAAESAVSLLASD